MPRTSAISGAVASALAAVLLCTPARAIDGAFPLGQSARSGAICNAQRDYEDPAAQLPHAKAWTIACRGWDATFGRLYSFDRDFTEKTGNPEIWRSALAERADCGAFGAASVAGMGNVRRASCSAKPGKTPYGVYVADTADHLVIAEGFAPLDELVQVGMRVVAGVAPPPNSAIQRQSLDTPGTALGVQSLADAAQSAHLAPGWLREHAHRENQTWRFGEAARDFQVLTSDADLTRRDRAMVQLNWALNFSDEGSFQEADTQFDAAADLAAGAKDPQIDVLALNYRALHKLNQGLFGDARRLAEQALERGRMGVAAASASERPTVSGGDIEIGPGLAAALNRSTKSAGFRAQRLSDAERLQILIAQANYIKGCASQGVGDVAGARASLIQADTLLNKTAVGRSAAWLRAQIVLQIARLDLIEHHPERSLARLSSTVAYFQSQQYFAASPAEAALYLALARSEVALGQTQRALQDFATSMDLFRQTRGTLGFSANETAPYFDLLIASARSDPNGAERYKSLFFDAMQSVIGQTTARTMERVAARISQGDANSAAAARALEDAERQRTVKEAQIQHADGISGYAAEQKSQDAAELKRLNEEVQALQQQLLAANPRYGELVASTATLADMRKALRPGEAYVKSVLLSNGGYGIAITSAGADVYALPLSRSKAAQAVAELRKPFNSADVLPPFDVDASHRLFNAAFGPVSDQVANAKHLIYEPDGVLIGFPAGAFVIDEASADLFKTHAAEVLSGKKGVDLYKGVAWLGRGTDISLSVSAPAFLQSRALPASHAPRIFAGFGAPVMQSSDDARRFSLLTSGRKGENLQLCDRSRLAMVKGIGQIPGAAETISAIGKDLGALPGDLVIGQDFTDIAVQSRTDLDEYRVLFFGTHGLLPDNDACLPEPALVTSLGSGNSDALLDASEILRLKLDADLVVLSACNTGGAGSASPDRTGLVGSGEALGGLARDFIYAGSRGLIVSQWDVDADATLELMRKLFKANGATQGDALRQAEVAMMDKREFSHPFYWAGFSLIGDGSRRMPGRQGI